MNVAGDEERVNIDLLSNCAFKSCFLLAHDSILSNEEKEREKEDNKKVVVSIFFLCNLISIDRH